MSDTQVRVAVVAPLDPTPEMIAAGLKVDLSNESEISAIINLWHAMASAAPDNVPPEGFDDQKALRNGLGALSVGSGGGDDFAATLLDLFGKGRRAWPKGAILSDDEALDVIHRHYLPAISSLMFENVKLELERASWERKFLDSENGQSVAEYKLDQATRVVAPMVIKRAEEAEEALQATRAQLQSMEKACSQLLEVLAGTIAKLGLIPSDGGARR